MVVSFQAELFLDRLHRPRLQLLLRVHWQDGLPAAEVDFEVAAFLGAEQASVLFQPPLQLSAGQTTFSHLCETRSIVTGPAFDASAIPDNESARL